MKNKPKHPQPRPCQAQTSDATARACVPPTSCPMAGAVASLCCLPHRKPLWPNLPSSPVIEVISVIVVVEVVAAAETVRMAHVN